MHKDTKAGTAPARNWSTLLGGLVTAAVMLTVTGFALSAIGSWATAGQAPITAGDDAVANGMLLEPTADQNAGLTQPLTSARTAESTEIILQDWTFTARPRPSPK
jgi:hypothetical protein